MRRPADAPNEAAAYYPRLAQAVRDAMEYVYLESGDRKSIAFDLGTSEGPDCVDVQRVSLPRPSAYYIPPQGALSSNRLRDDLAGLLGPQPSPRNFLVYVPSILNRQAGGLAAVPNDDSPSGAAYRAGGQCRTSDRTPRFRVLADEDAVRIRCRIDGPPFRRCGRRFVAPELDSGRHLLRALARDRAGNSSPEPARLRFRVCS